METTRRALLSGGVVGLAVAGAGCARRESAGAGGDDEGSESGGESGVESEAATTAPVTPRLAVRVRNRTDVADVVAVTLLDADGAVLERRTDRRVPPGVDRTMPLTGYESGPYSVQVQADDWVAGALWRLSECRRYRVDVVVEGSGERPLVSVETECVSAPTTEPIDQDAESA